MAGCRKAAALDEQAPDFKLTHDLALANADKGKMKLAFAYEVSLPDPDKISGERPDNYLHDA
jgi:hypothetical protein